MIQLNEYLINKQKVRLKDVIDLILDSGLGKDSLSMISQGNISSFAEAKPHERRAIFEEAAGVSKKYLYEHFYVRINELRENQGKRKRIKGLIKSDKSKDVIIQAKDKRIKELEERVRYLELLLNKQCADIYDNL